MLLNVHIKNIALIEDANINFTEGLNILTGETGAGKSIIMGALKLGLGGKMAKDVLRDPSKEGFCQLLFLVDGKVADELASLDVTPSEDDEIIITRRIVNGRTINTINDITVTAAKLREVSAHLIDMHAQNEQQTLLKRASHMNILDKFGKEKIAPLKDEYQTHYKKYTAIKAELAGNALDEAERLRKLEFTKYEIDEIESANIKTGEDVDLEATYKKMVNSKDIVEGANDAYEITGYTKGNSAGNEIGRAVQLLKNVKEMDSDLAEIYDELVNIDALLNDFNMELSSYISDMEFDDSQFSQVENRLNTINNIKGKYGRTLEDVMAYLASLKETEQQLFDYEEYVDGLNKALAKEEKELKKSAKALTAERKKQAELLCKEVSVALEDLSFNQVDFSMTFEELDAPGANGADDAYFMISTNVGEKARPLYDVASGGELSRIMLAIKSSMADSDNIDTLIFDEIDVGISGRAASSVASRLATISKAHQVISITHLPQIAAMADSHYMIEKVVRGEKTVTEITKLSQSKEIVEIARLLDGATISEAAMNNARHMKDVANKAKRD